MKAVIGILSLLALGVSAVPLDQTPAFIRDDAGNLHMVNPDPYSEVDAEFEPFFDAERDMIFQLFTPLNPAHGQMLQWYNPTSVNNSFFDPAWPTRFTIHGWYGDEDSALHSHIRQHYLAVGEFNVITVDWGKGANTINYITARNRVGAVGDVISRMIDTLILVKGISRDSVSLIGHSLGAHAAGVAGKLHGGRIQTIVGLDPAGPLFSLGQKDILDPSDAQYVEAVFSATGSLGFEKPLGDANFYPNGGRSQPGCGMDLGGICSHARAHELFSESLSTRVGFRAARCVSHEELLSGACTSSGPEALMGGEPSNHGRGVNGIYRFNTNEKSPFAQG